jgi:hypothetical protein
MADYCAVISGIHGEKEQVAIIHHPWCSHILESVCEEMLVGNRAVVASLESSDKLSVSIEIKIISGMKIPVVWHKCTTTPSNTVHYRINEGGGLMVDKTGNGKMIGCWSCGAMTSCWDMLCKGCGESLWKGFDERMFEYNRRIREGIRNNNKKLVAISKHSIQIAIDQRGGKVGWSSDSNGFAKRPANMKQLPPEYKEDMADIPVPTSLPKPPKHRKLPPKRIQ